MAIASTSVFEYRPATGSNTNGGFYKSDAGTTDYSQQASAQWTGTNISSDGAGTAITDDDTQGLWTAQMVGNGVYITGGDGFTTGWYEIVTFTDSDNIIIDRSAGASKSGGTGNVGGALALPTDAILDTMIAGNICWLKAGTYTFTATWTPASDGNGTAHIIMKGYNSSRGDNPAGTDRPLFAMSTHTISAFGANYWQWSDIRSTHNSGTATTIPWHLNTQCVASNLKIERTGSAGNCIRNSTEGDILECELLGTGTTEVTNHACVTVGAATNIQGCYMHDNGIGVLSLSTDYSITNNVVDTCGKGVYLKTSGIFVSKNTFYTCSDAAIDVEDAATTILRASYNVIDSCGDGINSANAHGNFPYLDWNNWSNNTADIGANMSVAAKGEHATADAPGFADAPNGDFAPSGLAQLTSATGSLFYQGAVQTSGENGGVQVGYVGS